MEISAGRLNDPSTISESWVSKTLSEHGEAVIQFSKPSSYNPGLLAELNSVCRRSSHGLEVRFYGHYSTSFDAEILRYLPDVKSLTVDCLTSIAHEDEIGQLQNLSLFRFGVFEFERPEFLEILNLGSIKTLYIGENRKRNFDLSVLGACRSLETLSVTGHWRGIEAVSDLSSLQTVRLNAFAKSHNIQFLNGLPNLTELVLTLGGRENLDEFSSQSLKSLQVLRVRGLSSLSEFSRFPNLRHLRIEDEIQLQRLDLAGANLERLWLGNCKNLRILLSLNKQNNLKELYASRVALDLGELRDFTWPNTMEAIGLFSSSLKWNEETKAHLAGRGYRQCFGPWH